MKRAAAIFALIIFFASSVTGGFVVVLCERAQCDTRPATPCQEAKRMACRSCCPAETGCPQQERAHQPKEDSDRTMVIVLPLLAVDGCDVQRCPGFCSGSSISEFRDQLLTPKPDPVILTPAAPAIFAFESPPPANIHASRPAGVFSHLQSVMLRC